MTKPRADILFDPETHTYTHRATGAAIPSVTQILSDLGLIDATWFNAEARTRGQYVAQATWLLDCDDLDRKSCDPRIELYVSAWQKFKRESAVEILAGEELVYSDCYDYAGTLDRRVRLLDRTGVIDIKTGAPAPWHALQVIAYAACFPEALARWCVYLNGNGGYKLVEHTGANDLGIWYGAAALHRWKRQHA